MGKYLEHLANLPANSDSEAMRALLNEYFSKQGNEMISRGKVALARDSCFNPEKLLQMQSERDATSLLSTFIEAAKHNPKVVVLSVAEKGVKKAVEVLINGSKFSISVVNGVLTINPVTAPIGAAISIAAGSLEGALDARSINNSLKWFYEAWNKRADLEIDINQVTEEGVPDCTPYGTDIVKWTINPLFNSSSIPAISALRADGLNQAQLGSLRMKYHIHNEIVDTVFAYCCCRLLKKYAEADSKKKVIGQVTVPIGKLKNYVSKRLPFFAAPSSGDINAVAEMLTAHLLQCNCTFTRDFLSFLVGSKRFPTVYSDIFNDPGKAMTAISDCLK